ncbi:hypothetical protein HQ576_09255, partial [bacterium]|nr:hypothetical protein [bacterium]
MNRIPLLLTALAVACAATARARERKDRQGPKAKIEDAKRVLVPIFDPDTGKRVAVIEAVTVTPDPKNPQHMRATDVRILAVQDTDQGKKTHVIHGKLGVFDMAAKRAHLQRDVVIVFDDAEAEKDRTRIYADDLLWDGQTG